MLWIITSNVDLMIKRIKTSIKNTYFTVKQEKTNTHDITGKDRWGNMTGSQIKTSEIVELVKYWRLSSLQALCSCSCLWPAGCCGTAETSMASRPRRSSDTSAAPSTASLATSAARSARTGVSSEISGGRLTLQFKSPVTLLVSINMRLNWPLYFVLLMHTEQC